MLLHYDENLVVLHDDPQTVEGLVKRTKAAQKNAAVFERLHPELQIVPRGIKKIVLRVMCYVVWPLRFIPQVKWWRLWKQAWTD